MHKTCSIRNAAGGSTLCQRFITAFLALVLAVGLMPHASLAWADDDTFSVALTVVDTTDSENPVVKNVKVDGLTSDNTVADLLSKAGFTSGDQAASAADPSVYFNSNGSPYFNGKGYDSVTGNYWATMFNGDSANWAKAILTAKLEANGHYQYIYTDASTFSYASADGTFPVQLTVVDTTDSANGVLANVKVDGMTSEDTVADLLEKAGFTKVATAAETEGNDKAYAESGGSPVFRGNKTTQNEDGTWTYWVTMFNGDSANYASAQTASKLVFGGHYQYIYTNDSTYAYGYTVSNLVSVSDVTDPLASADPTPDPDPTPTPDPTPDPVVSNTYNAESAQTLLANLTKRFSIDGADASISNNTVNAAIALNSLGLSSNIDSAAILANLNKQASEMTAGRMGKFIMALTAAGIDCTKVDDNGSERNLVSEMESLETSGSVSVYDAVWILPVYQYGSYAQSAGMSESELVSTILDSADDAGLFGNAQYGCDTQTTAQGILALLPYRDSAADVDAALTKAVETVLSYENPDGGFGYSASSTDSNLDATATIVCALEALGYDTATGKELTTESDSTPLGYLIANADSALDGYLNASAYDEPQTSAAVLLALAAHKGAQDSGEAYSVYTLNKANGSKTDDTAKNSASSSGKSSSTSAKTGDAPVYPAVLAAVALGALATGLGAQRRMRAAKSSSLHMNR